MSSEKNRSPRHLDRLSSIIWLVVSLAICIEGYRLRVGPTNNPDSGFVIFWLGVIMAGLSVGILIQALLEPASPKGEMRRWPDFHIRKTLPILTVLFLYGYSFDSLGFFIATISLLLFLFKWIAPQRWGVAAFGSLLTTSAVYVIFDVWLGNELPLGGILEALIW